MADSDIVDSQRRVHSYPPSVDKFLQEHREEIVEAAKIAGVPPAAVAAPIAREMTIRELDHSSLVQSARDRQSINNALHRPLPSDPNSFNDLPPPLNDPKYDLPLDLLTGNQGERYTHKDYVDDMAECEKGVQRDWLTKPYFRVAGSTDHPVLNDLPPANIRPWAAITAVMYYNKHMDTDKTDPLNLNQYTEHYDKLVDDMADPQKAASLSIKISAANAAYINHDLEKKVSNWNALTEDQRVEAIAAYSPSGGKQFNKKYEAYHNQPYRLDPADLNQTDGAKYLTAPFKGDTPTNIERLHEILGDTPQPTIRPSDPDPAQAHAPEKHSEAQTPQGPFGDAHADRYFAALLSGDSAAMDRIAVEFSQTPQGQQMAQSGDQALAQQQSQQQQQDQSNQSQQAPSVRMSL